MPVINDGQRDQRAQVDTQPDPAPWCRLKTALKVLAHVGLGQLIGWLLRRWLG